MEEVDKNYYTPEELEKILQEHNISMEDFGEFIYGQGCPLVDGVPCYFVSDVNRFVEGKTYRQKHIRMIADMLKAAAEDERQSGDHHLHLCRRDHQEQDPPGFRHHI